MNATQWDPWNYRESVTRDISGDGMVGYKVHASDGDIGKVDEANEELGNAQIVVDTGPWIFGRKVILPAGVIERVDDQAQEIHVALTKDQIKASPELDETAAPDDPDYRDKLGTYYGDVYRDRLGGPGVL
ncbi:hypothetical protein GCM10028820_13990 [Tessaracoccus terricola]